MTVYNVVGARPQFIKAAVVSRALRRRNVREVIVHTGQHYDPDMSAIFFDELGIPDPDVHLDAGSGSHAHQTGEIMVRLEDLLEDRRDADWVLVYGDTNSTIAAALTAAKLNIPVAHVEAGLRSFNRRMAEEINRVVTDRLAQRLFCPTETARKNLAGDGIEDGVVLTGDVMLEAVQIYGHSSEGETRSGAAGHEAGRYYLASIHRAENTEDPRRLKDILTGFSELDRPVVLPLHPRTRKRIDVSHFTGNVEVIEPVGYPVMLSLIRHAAAVLTDSGGVQKEAYWLGVPCVTLRDETEWVETLENGWNQLTAPAPDAIRKAVARTPSGPRSGFGQAPAGVPSEIIVESLSDREA